MLRLTDSPWAEWYVVNSDDKQSSRLNVISHILKSVPYENIAPEPCKIPPRETDASYCPPPEASTRGDPSTSSTSVASHAAEPPTNRERGKLCPRSIPKSYSRHLLLSWCVRAALLRNPHGRY